MTNIKEKVQYTSKDWYKLSSLLAWADFYKQNNRITEHYKTIEQINRLQTNLKPR
jgi:hypothetical protein